MNKVTNPSEALLTKLPGIALCLLLAVPAWLLGLAFPIVGGPVIAIVGGIVLTTVWPGLIQRSFHGAPLSRGIQYTSKKLLQYSIILLGFEMNLYNVIRVGGQSLQIMFFTLTLSFLTAWLMGRLLRLPGDITVLVGVGTSICGGSAIAATSPVIGAKDEDISQAISTIFLFNIIAVLIFPAMGRSMGMSDVSFGMWAGTAINDTSSVVAAGAAWSTEALQLATIVKLTRTLMIVPITLVLALYTACKKGRDSSQQFNFFKVFPWFVIFFLVACLVNTFVLLPLNLGAFSTFLTQVGKFMIVMAMAAIGLSTNLRNLIQNGFRPIALGLSCWFVVSVVSLMVQRVMGL